jgi:hypothetical protein
LAQLLEPLAQVVSEAIETNQLNRRHVVQKLVLFTYVEVQLLLLKLDHLLE